MSSQIVPSQTMPSETEARSNRSDEALALEEDARLRTDIRLLGRILGDTVRDQEGADVFDLVERIRQTSIRFHRDEDKLARRELETHPRQHVDQPTPCGSSAPSAISRISPTSPRTSTTSARCAARARRRRRGRARWPRRWRTRKTAGFSAAELRGFFGEALVSPVLTAHPTEVRRKSTIDREMEIAALLDRARARAADAGRGRGQRRAVAPRRADAVADQPAAPDQADRARRGRERPVVLRLHVPARGAAAALRAGGPAEPGATAARRANWRPSCAWEAGSAATATAIRSSPPTCMRGTLRLQSSRVLSFYLEELHALGARAVAGGASCRRLRRAARAGRALARHARRIAAASPIACAVSGIYARLAATALRAARSRPPRRPVGEAAPYAERRRSSRPISTCSTAR